jgi:hypothetical protein
MEQISFKYNGNIVTVKVNDKFNRLTILEIFKDKYVCAKCKCDCGTIIERIVLRSLLSGNTKSCGCLNKELREQRNYKHGDGTRTGKTRLYKIWQDMKRRCYSETRGDAKNYYDKGITVCAEWQLFQNFKNWAINNGYTEELTIERKDNNKGYCPENCCWIKKSEQSKNRTSNHYITYNNKTMTLTDWSKYLGIKRTTLSSRLRRGWTVEQAFTTN